MHMSGAKENLRESAEGRVLSTSVDLAIIPRSCVADS